MSLVISREIIGRERELAALDRLLAEAGAGHGRSVVVSGDAGIGKSALLRRFLSLHEADVDLFSAECTTVGARPFGPLLDAFAARGVDLPVARDGDAPAETAVIHSAILRALRARMAERVAVLAVEDIHWADDATLGCLEHLARRIPGTRILVVATARSDEPMRDELERVLAQLDRSHLVTRITLDPLDLDGTGRLLESALGLQRAPAQDLRAAVHARCEGNPYFTEEVMRTLIERDDVQRSDGSWTRADLPPSIAVAVEQRLSRLDPIAREVLRVAAVLGNADPPLLAEIGRFREQDVADALRVAIDAQLVVEDPDRAHDPYRFRHALTRETVLAGIADAERRELHRAAAFAIERRAGRDLGGSAERLAHHFHESGHRTKTIQYALLAADRASRAASYSAARRHLERALELAPADHPDLARIHLRLSRAHYLEADHRRALEHGTIALSIAIERGDASTQGAAEVFVARTLFSLGRSQERDAALGRAIALLEPLGASIDLADAYTLEMSIAWFERWPNAIEVGERALQMCERVGWVFGRVRAVNILGLAIFYTGGRARQDEAIRLLRDGLAMAQKNESVDVTERAVSNLYEALIRMGRPASECHPLRVVALEHAKRYGFTAEEEWEVAYEAGDWDRSLEIIEEHSGGTSLFAAKRALYRAVMTAFRDGPAAALGAAAAAAARLAAGQNPQWTAAATVRAVIRALAGDLDGAISDVRAALSLEADYYMEDALVAGMVAAHELGREADLSLLIERARAQLASVRSDSPDEAARLSFQAPVAAFARALEAERRGDPEVAIGEYERAAESGAVWGRWYSATQARLRRARLLVARGRTDAARGQIGHVLPHWRRAKAAWYVSELGRATESLGAVASS